MEKRKRQCEDRGRASSDTVTIQEIPRINRSWNRQGTDSFLEPLVKAGWALSEDKTRGSVSSLGVI